MTDLLTKAERARVEEVRTRAAVNGTRDTRTPSDLRRKHRQLIAIIDRLAPPPAAE